MNIITLSKKQLENLERLQLEEEISNKEAIIYKTTTLPKHKVKKDSILKYVHIKNKESFANKLFTISLLSDYKEKIGIKELVIPETLVSVENEIVGFTMPEIKNATNLGLLLHDETVSIKKKLRLLKSVGELLNKTQNLEKYGIHLYFNDLHEYNFLIDNDNENLYAIDLDSATMTTEYPQSSYYMMINKNLSSANQKYKCNAYGISYPDHNTDLLCFNMMVIDTIANYKVSMLSLEDYYDYIGYLSTIGFEKEIIDAFVAIYTNKNNINVSNYFEQIPYDNLNKATYEEYKHNNFKKIN